VTNAPAYLLKAPKGNPAITLLTGIGLSAVFNSFLFLVLYPEAQCCGFGKWFESDNGRLFLLGLGSLSVAFSTVHDSNPAKRYSYSFFFPFAVGASAILSKVLFSTIAKMFNNSVRFDHPDVELYATTGYAYHCE